MGATAIPRSRPCGTPAILVWSFLWKGNKYSSLNPYRGCSWSSRLVKHKLNTPAWPIGDPTMKMPSSGIWEKKQCRSWEVRASTHRPGCSGRCIAVTCNIGVRSQCVSHLNFVDWNSHLIEGIVHGCLVWALNKKNVLLRKDQKRSNDGILVWSIWSDVRRWKYISYSATELFELSWILDYAIRSFDYGLGRIKYSQLS